MSKNELLIKGARQNNLKNISLNLPHNKVIAITGVSGSGKSSLAFDTIFAEGQWRFIESLSTYARLFMEKLDRPDVDSIEHIRPAIALEQRNPVRGSRSTVGTLTELYDFLRLLFAKASTPHCPKCGIEIRAWDPSAIKHHLLDNHAEAKAAVVFTSALPLPELQRAGFSRALKDGMIVDLDEPGLTIEPPIDVVLDRLIVRDEPRLSDSLETAFREGHGTLKVALIDGPTLSYSKERACDRCGLVLPEPSPLLFSFNHPLGACPECKGFGNVLKYDEALIVPDAYLSLAEGAVDTWEKPAARWWKTQMLKGIKKTEINPNTPFKDLPEEHKRMVFEGCEQFYGVDDFFEELEGKRYKLHVRVFLSRYRKGVLCPRCHGKRLCPEALAYKVSGMDIADMSALSIDGLAAAFRDLDISLFKRDMAKEILRQIDLKLKFLARVGLGYLTLSREGKTLSGGEYQRVNLSNQLASHLTGTLYVLDEPTVGLHKRDTDRVTEIMSELAAMGNTIIVVEHDASVIARADWAVELGPGGGHLGGNIVFSGPMDKFLKSDTVTAAYMRSGASSIMGRTVRKPSSVLRLLGATGNNLKAVSVDFPLGLLVSITGVSGSGKSTLVVDTLYRALARELRLGSDTPLPYEGLTGFERLKGAKLIDQSPIGRSPRSNPLSYLKVFDPLRKLFASEPEARAHNMGPGYFSFNLPGGRCEACKGEGYQKVEMYFFEDLYIKCEECGGKRYTREALSIAYRGKNIDDVLNMTVEEAEVLFRDQAQIREKLTLMKDIGLGYLRLGQPSTTLSGGEAQRLKLCAELGTGRLRDMVYILDEPTVGLHARDVKCLMDVLGRLVASGNTVIVIEHNLDVIAASDWIIDMGPEGGEAGGRLVFAGTPGEIREDEESYTGRYLEEMLHHKIHTSPNRKGSAKK